MTALYLRTTDAQGRAHGGFQWPLEVGATVTAPDWKPTAEFGNGLHGLLNGEGDADHLSNDADAIWWIVEASNAIDLGGKHKFQTCRVVAFGPREDITPKMRRMTGGAVHRLIEAGGDDSTLTGGSYSTLTGGNRSTLTGGNYSTLTGGDYSTLTGGSYSTLTGGNRSTLTGGDCSTLTGGDDSTLIFLCWIEGHRRVLTAYVGENGIKPGAPYRANDDFTAVVEATA